MTARDNRPDFLARAIAIAVSLVAGFFGLEAALSPLAAQKETFERSKPHLNVGTVNADESGASRNGCCGEKMVGAPKENSQKPPKYNRRNDQASHSGRR